METITLKLIFFSGLVFCLTGCKELPKQNISELDNTKESVRKNDTILNKNIAQLDLKDSFRLKHIQGQFYKNKKGQLFERTIGQKEINGHLADFVYFNGDISQEVDPLSFKSLYDSWYAKDKNNVYYYRPVSGGMMIEKIDTADTKTFKVLTGHYKYAMDKNFFYKESQIINGFIPNKTKLQLDNKGRATKMICNNNIYNLELVN